jgi:hypothetical protein
MNLHLRAPCAAVLCAAALAAGGTAAQNVYKCTVDGKVGYSDLPCPAGATASSQLAVPATPPADPAAADDLQRQRKQSAALQKAREKTEQRDAREAERQARGAAVRRQRCAKLALAKRWADEDARGASAANADKARLRARRAGESLSVECAH